MENFYAILGVRNEASLAEIKKAYREKVKSFHPDMTGDNSKNKEFAKVVNAYRVLSDFRQRSIFDDSFFMHVRRKNSSHSENEFDYYKWLNSRTDDESRAKLIFYCLMKNREDEAVLEFKKMQSCKPEFKLSTWFTREDFMDYGYILCEELVLRAEFYDAFLLLEQIIKMEKSFNYFRLFFSEVLEFTLNILHHHIEGQINDELALDVFERALDLEFGKNEDVFILKKMGMIYKRIGDDVTAAICNEEAFKIAGK